ncbi:MAG: uroporphyrinogen-III synthase [Gammaproteobacteria bacterium]|nr:uroporphyrinogen-III synthase [Gammaproteobacteria bacterium]
MTEPGEPPHRPLAGRRILITRPAEQTAVLATGIRSAGGQPLLFPTLTIGPPQDPAAAAAATRTLPNCTGAIFISANAAHRGLELIQRIFGKPPPGPAYLAVGPASSTVLVAAGINSVTRPAHQFSSEGLLALPALQAPLTDQNFLIFRGDGGREYLADQLRQRGATVTYVACYHRNLPTDGPDLALLWQNPGLDWVTANSREGLENLLRLTPESLQAPLRHKTLIVLSAAVAERARELGFTSIQIAPESSDAGMLAALHDLAAP